MNSFYACLLLSVTLQFATSQNTPSITFISPTQIGDVGGTVELQCSAKNAQDIPIIWSKVGEYPIIISSGYALLLPDSRYSIRHNYTSSTFTLKIQHLQLEDAGLYQCNVLSSRDNRLTADVELQVRQTAASDNDDVN